MGDTRFRRGRQCARVVPGVKWGDLVSTEEQAHGYEFRVYSAVGLEEDAWLLEATLALEAFAISPRLRPTRAAFSVGITQ